MRRIVAALVTALALAAIPAAAEARRAAPKPTVVRVHGAL